MQAHKANVSVWHHNTCYARARRKQAVFLVAFPWMPVGSQRGRYVASPGCEWPAEKQILEVAFARPGFQQTRMDGTASLAGLSKGTLYLHYTSPALQWMERLMQLALEFYALTGHDREMRQFFYQ
ncbi:MAG TPA: hypothetical protein VGF67_10100 [Ktedonobacteraceae bacterium]